VYFLETMMYQKNIGSASRFEGSESKIYMQKQGFLFCRVKTKIKMII
jgi:hypothetical protein